MATDVIKELASICCLFTKTPSVKFTVSSRGGGGECLGLELGVSGSDVHIPAVWPGASHLTSLSFRFCMPKREVMTAEAEIQADSDSLPLSAFISSSVI